MKKTADSAGSSPSPALLGLVQSFLSNHGLTSTKKAFSREIQRKSKSSNWAHPPEVAPLDGVSLEDVFDSYTEAQLQIAPSNISNASASDSTSNTTSDDSDSEEEAPVKMKSKPKKSRNKRREVSPSDSSSSESSATSSSSDSDADDESEEELKINASPQASARALHVKNLKRKAESSSIDDSSLESDSDSDSSTSSQGEQPVKRVKLAARSDSSSADGSSSDESLDHSDAEMMDSEAVGAQLVESSAGSGDDSSDSSSDDSSDSDDSSVDAASAEDEATTLANGIEAGSDSSGTIVGDKQESSRSGSVSDGPLRDGIQVVEVKREITVKKHIGARPTPLAQLSALATDDSHISNQYISYEYADKAFRDLSVTRGKGFTKEKNKKKRGSYRGGAIDISGGKAFKFED